MSAAPAPAPGYELLGLLRRGRDLDVYDAWSEERACRCVVKTLRADGREGSSARSRLLREGRLLKRLTHPHLVRAYEALAGPPPMVVLETLGGETLGHVVEVRRRRLPAADLVHLGLQLCSAVGYLHRHGILHLDLKPSNIVCEENGCAKLLDLSVARKPGRAPRGVGTRAYLAPEQARGGVLGPPADVWGIGAVLWEAATAHPPFGPGDGDHAYEQLARRAEPVRAHRRLPAELTAVIDACLEPEPDARPAVEEIASALDALADRLS